MYIMHSISITNHLCITGNDKISAITNQRPYSLRIDMEDFDGNWRFAEYSDFKVDDVWNKYKLHIDGYSGDAGMWH